MPAAGAAAKPAARKKVALEDADGDFDAAEEAEDEAFEPAAEKAPTARKSKADGGGPVRVPAPTCSSPCCGTITAGVLA